ncbi:hypothetical protein GYMLUDRAFT_464472 [Collybiopsis luxurians FD-317 M1]|uniref:Uncharacterized protein n=1 Tax=Collybiopsis luxurians FD-317 M1 TaxID=944289 RepID=A0A0D0C5A2_9AGAR|nr:hypothetical protein GYMLUDRAFT_464472 [Collybiopsis luxurians FD-317 M1]
MMMNMNADTMNRGRKTMVTFHPGYRPLSLLPTEHRSVVLPPYHLPPVLLPVPAPHLVPAPAAWRLSDPRDSLLTQKPYSVQIQHKSSRKPVPKFNDDEVKWASVPIPIRVSAKTMTFSVLQVNARRASS